MTILFASSEDIDLPLTSGVYLNPAEPSTAHRDVNYSRSSMRLSGTGGALNIFAANVVPTTKTTWLTFRFRADATTGNNADGDLINFNGGGVGVAQMDVTNGVWRIKINDSGFVQVGNTFGISTNFIKLTLQLVIDDTNGVYQIWENDLLRASFFGDTTGTHGQTMIDQITFRESHPSTSADVFYSEIVIANEPTHNFRVATLVPEGDGNDVEWSGGWADVDENTMTTADNLISSTAEQVEMMNLTAYIGNTELHVKTIFVSANAKKSVISAILLEDDAGLLQLEDGTGNLLLEDGSGPEQLQLGVRHGATSAFSSTKTLLEDSLYGTVSDQFTINPDTGIAWTIADLATLQAGIKSKP